MSTDAAVTAILRAWLAWQGTEVTSSGDRTHGEIIMLDVGDALVDAGLVTAEADLTPEGSALLSCQEFAELVDGS